VTAVRVFLAGALRMQLIASACVSHTTRKATRTAKHSVVLMCHFGRSF